MTYAFAANFAGLPAVTVPSGHVRGMPVGLHLMARPGRDGLLLAIAKRLEEHFRWAEWRPPVETRKASRTRQDG
jgi:amidase